MRIQEIPHLRTATPPFDSRPEGCICYSPDDLCTVRVVVSPGMLLPVELDAAQLRCTVTIITVMTQTECSSRRTCPSNLDVLCN